MRWLSVVAPVMVALMLAGCGIAESFEETDKAARLAYDQLRRGEDAALLASFEPGYRNTDSLAALAEMRKVVPEGEPVSAKARSWNSAVRAGEGRTMTLSHEYDYGDRVVMAETVLVRTTDPEGWQIRGFHVVRQVKGAGISGS